MNFAWVYRLCVINLQLQDHILNKTVLLSPGPPSPWWIDQAIVVTPKPLGCVVLMLLLITIWFNPNKHVKLLWIYFILQTDVSGDLCKAIRSSRLGRAPFLGPELRNQKHMLSPVWLPSLAWTRVRSLMPGLIRHLSLIPFMIIYDLWNLKIKCEKGSWQNWECFKGSGFWEEQNKMKKKKILWRF